MMAEARTAAPIAIDCLVEAGAWPEEEELQAFAERAIAAASSCVKGPSAAALTILFTDDAHMQMLNGRFRGKDSPTNVLSFPAAAGLSPLQEPHHLGDLALGFETVFRESEDEGKPFDHHLSHLLIHGFLHLLGYDHVTPEQAEKMESLEKQALKSLAISDPYA